MPDIDWNRSLWDGSYDWAFGGEEWSSAWGGSEAQWFGALFPRLHRLLPASSILEIAPGYGRWSRFLIPACAKYVGVDLSRECVQACTERFSSFPHATFKQNDGRSLESVGDGPFDLIFSFDSLVHAEANVIEDYVAGILPLLTEQGAAFLHHSNLCGLSIPEDTHTHFRAKSVSSEIVAAQILRNGGEVLVQEIISWPAPTSESIDCLTTFRRRRGEPLIEVVRIDNPRFAEEASIIAATLPHYCRRR